MNLTSSTIGPIVVIRMAESRIDATVAIQFKDEMRVLTQASNGRVVLDLSAVEFIDSSGLGAVVAAMKQMDGDRRLELSGLTPTVDKVFRLTRMDTIFTIHTDLDAATATDPA